MGVELMNNQKIVILLRDLFDYRERYEMKKNIDYFRYLSHLYIYMYISFPVLQN